MAATTITGIVTKKSGEQTVRVVVNTRKTHPIYRKSYTVSKNFLVHDPKNEAAEGDKVQITETRPISKRKTWILSKIVERGGENK